MTCCKHLTSGSFGPSCCPARPKIHQCCPAHDNGNMAPCKKCKTPGDEPIVKTVVIKRDRRCPIHGDKPRNSDLQNGKNAQPVSPFDKPPFCLLDVNDIPLCNNLAFFDHPPGCNKDMERLGCNVCAEFTVDPKSFKINHTQNNNINHENGELEQCFLTEDSDNEEEFKEGQIKSCPKKSPWLYETETSKSAKYDRNTFEDTIESGNTILVKLKQRPSQSIQEFEKKQPVTSDDVEMIWNKSKEQHESGSRKEDELLQNWINSLRVSENAESQQIYNCNEKKNKSLQEKCQNMTQLMREETNMKTNYTCNHGTPRCKRPYHQPSKPLEEMFQSENSRKFSKSKLSFSAYPILNMYSKKNGRGFHAMECNLQSGDHVIHNREGNCMPGNDQRNLKSRNQTQGKSKKTENFIRKNILRVKSYQKQFKVISQPYLDNSQERGTPKNIPSKSCHETVNKNSKNRVEDQRLPENILKTPPGSPRNKDDQKSSEKAVVVNPKTGSVKSITFEIDDIESKNITARDEGDLRLPVISLKSGSKTEVSAECSNSVQVQKDIFQIKGFVYETVAGEKETLYISYKNLKKLICNYSKKLNLKKSDESMASQMTLVLRDKVGI